MWSVRSRKERYRHKQMKACGISAFIFLLPVTRLWSPVGSAVVVHRAHFGSAVTLSCNVSYLYYTTWLKHNPNLPPTVILCASLKEGNPVQGFRLSPRYSVSVMNRSLALRIAGVEEGDLGLYYCTANVNDCVVVGRGTVLQVPGSSQILSKHWYSAFVGSGVLLMMAAVCITHWKTKQKKSGMNHCEHG